MREIVIKIYKYDELCKASQKVAIEKYRWDVMNLCMDCSGEDYVDTLAKLSKVTGFKAVDWHVEYCNYRVRVCKNNANHDTLLDYFCPDEITGRLLFRYVNRSIMPYLEKGKYYCVGSRWIDGKYHYQYRYSRIFNQYDNCTLTGMCFELNFEEKLIHYYTHWNEYPNDYSLEDLMGDCYNNFFKAWHKEYEYYGDEDEGIIDHFEANDWEFTEDGVRYN